MTAPAAPAPRRGEVVETVPTVDAHGARVQRMFSDIAHGYDRANRWMSLWIDVLWRRKAVADLLPADAVPTPDRRPRILDLCAGTLDSTLEIHRRYPDADVVGGDFSAGMLAHGTTKLHGAAAERVTPKQMDAHALPEDDDSLDAIFCAFGVRNLSDLPRATAEQARCLRPGGRLVVLEFFRPSRLVTRLFHGIYNRTVLPLVGWLATGNLDAYLYLPRSIGTFERVEDYVALLERGGFRDVRIRPLTLGIACIVEAARSGPEEVAP